jgi:hypothetical protein
LNRNNRYVVLKSKIPLPLTKERVSIAINLEKGLRTPPAGRVVLLVSLMEIWGPSRFYGFLYQIDQDAADDAAQGHILLSLLENP